MCVATKTMACYMLLVAARYDFCYFKNQDKSGEPLANKNKKLSYKLVLLKTPAMRPCFLL